MKICVLSFHCCPFSLIGGDGVGGMNVYLKELCSRLTDIPDAEVDIFTRVQNPEIRGIRKQGASLRVVHLKGGPEHAFDRRKLCGHLPEFAYNLERFICEEDKRYDLIYSHYWLSGMAGVWMKHRFGLPLVHTFHTLAFLKNKAIGGLEHTSRIETEQDLVHDVDKIISTSTEEKHSLIKESGVYPGKIDVIYPGINQQLFYPVDDNSVFSETGFGEQDRILLYVGRIEPVKGLMSVIDAFNILQKRQTPLFGRLRLVVIGGGEKTRDFAKNEEIIRINRAVREKGLEDKVVFLGSKSQSELKKYYSKADALIVPSLYESFGLVVLEALACGTPVLVSQIGKMRTIVKEGRNGFCFLPDSPDSLSNCIEYFYTNTGKLWPKETIRSDIINTFSWERTAEETYRALDCLLMRRKFATTIFRPGGSLQPA
ncbi:MAG: glycosyltransferase [Candidatus Aminicenantes bacterium]|nr:glycosyltransferase [Candidatus Aminicenantes bacterium]